ncbi:Disease resistance protein [Rhynchospora pubera]|uniref:Disease resistance protein n=1 Tax=Rhynchospora pubera TaxID=906938 RepID=A0AAV8DL30_9POAL|nr:Disease resistance protein [Rhynchospora pubera]
MAEAAVLSAFMQVLFDKLSTAALDELDIFRTARRVHKELSSLTSTLSSIRALIEDAEEKQLKDKVVRLWLLKLKDIAYEIDDLLDDYAARDPKSKTQKPNMSRRHKALNNLMHYLHLSSGLFYSEVAVQIKKIRLKLNKLANERDSLGLQMFGGISRLEFTERPKTGSLVDKSSIFGREDDKENIIKLLLSRSGFITVLAIVGMGGLGKTTLAQLVYNDARIKEQFQVRIWVCVSENFDVMKLTKEAIDSVSTANISTTTNLYNTTNINMLQEDLCNKLKGKRFLLVLDDVWNEDSDKWESYYRALAVGQRGSAIIVTARNESVGRMMRAKHSYKLKQLSDEDCWELFKNYAFVNVDASSYPRLEKIGKEIVRKLKGLPLAAKTLGSLLYSKVEEEDWRSIAKSEIWELPSERNYILPALRLSYKHLPPHLKQCFAFCSIFHKDYVFEKDRLVYIWIALGFIKPQSRRRLEDIGISYFEELLSRSFFQTHKGRYVMHDAIHDLAHSVSADECLRLEESAKGLVTPERIRHASFSCDNSKPTSFEKFFPFEKLRTLLLLGGHKSSTEAIPTELFIKLKYVRVLDLNRRDISALPDAIGNLKQLRYLNLSGTRISNLPHTISKLRNLQTLRLKNCDALDGLPKGITRLVNLRHLEASIRLVRKIAGIGSLTSLQELEEFLVSKEKGYSIKELGDMTELTGSLYIRDLENVNTMVEASAARLNDKEYLTALHLLWSEETRVILEEECIESQVLESLRPNDHLKEITIKGFMGSKFPSWLNNLSFIQTIHLFDCKYSKSLPPLGKLHLLKYLDIGGFDALVHIGKEFLGSGNEAGFPSLTELILLDMSTLEDWVGDKNVENLPCLNELQLLQCPKLQHLPLLPPNLTRIRISESGFTILPRVYDSSLMLQPSLTSLQIHDCPNLMTLQQGLLDQNLGFLKELIITDCEELVHVPVNGFLSFVSLKSLHIYNCPKLMPIGEGSLMPPFLEDLRITECNQIVNPILREIKLISSLIHLSIKECTDLVLFAQEGLPLGLQLLEIFSCENLISLPDCLRELQSLTTLTIVNCPCIPCLPPNGLPKSLQELYIKECPLLMESCQWRGIDHHKIAHVPKVDIEDILPGQHTRRK